MGEAVHWGIGGALFADEIVLMSDTAEGLESNLKLMSQVLSRWEQKANWLRQENGKTKWRCKGKVADEVLEQVDEIKDLE